MSAEERDSRFQYHNKRVEVILKDGRRIIGLISSVDYDRRKFKVLESDRPGMMGKDGREFGWDDCRTVRAEVSGVEEGIFTDDMIPQWDRWSRASGVK
jgi:hypothetical protein